jgi:glycosyltransferase involved in cell wall biosynthesis
MINYKFSIITPTHIKNSYLPDLYESIKAQTYQNWEWVIYVNGKARVDNLPKDIRNDPRVKTVQATDKNTKVGHIKNIAFKLGTGDILVEVDHDDMITEDCLLELNTAFQDTTVGFAYSDNSKYHMKEPFQPYGAYWGWTHYQTSWQDKNLTVMNSFEPTSHSLSFIWYAPDHVRAWRKTVYDDLGGHNPEFSVCDDHELLIRTYLNTRFHYIPKPLYVYRITGDNTWLQRNEDIQIKTRELFNQYAWQLAMRDCEMRGLKAVDLGGGIDAKPGCVTIDIADADIIYDLNNGIPLPDNSVGVINASHVLEHLKDPIKSMKEIHRVLADGGWAFIEVPSTDGRGAWQDPTHVSYWNENSFWYYTRQDKARFIRNTTIRFQEFKLQTRWWENERVAVVDAWLVAVKGNQRRPHSVTI